VSAVQRSRTRTFSWEDPAAAAAAGLALPGLEYMSAVAAGTMPAPPIARLLEFSVLEVERGRTVFALTPAEWMYNPIGSVHGGIAATMLDSCMGCAVHTMLDAGVGYATADLQVRYVRSMGVASGRILAEGKVVHCGRRLATADGRIFTEQDRTLIAHGTTGCTILS
jgi:uncharacterized protein (TIGR00369 family)